MSSRKSIALVLIVLFVTACGVGGESEAGEPAPGGPADPHAATGRLEPGDLAYVGAFRLPEPSGGSNWEYSGYAMTYCPMGDAEGPADGFPGSLYVVGHDHHQQVSEISIPVPVRSKTKDRSALPASKTLQPFADVTAGRFGALEIPRAGLAYLPPTGAGTGGRLHFCWGQHLQFEQDPSHGWCNLDLASPATQGPWILGDLPNHTTNDYLFDVPTAWAAAHLGGAPLVTGRFRDGTWSGRGPALFAYTPPSADAPPARGSRIPRAMPLLLYGTIVPGQAELQTSPDRGLNTFKEADEWSGGAWLTAGGKAAVVLVGTKATGRCWYGFSNGVVFPISEDATEYPEVPPWPHDARGWWSEGIQGQVLFFDPADLAAVAAGKMEAWTPQPYAVLDLDPYLFDPGFDHERSKRFPVGAAAFDRGRGLLYVVERRADEDKSIVHVFRVGT